MTYIIILMMPFVRYLPGDPESVQLFFQACLDQSDETEASPALNYLSDFPLPPTDPSTTFEPQKPSHDVPELHKIPRSPYLEALELGNGRSGQTYAIYRCHNPTGPFTILEPRDQEISELPVYAAQERLTTDYDASNLLKGSSGKCVC